MNDADIEWLKAHKNERPRIALAEHLGVTTGCLYFWLRRLGADIGPSPRVQLTDEKREAIRRMYPDHPDLEIVRALHTTYVTICRVAQEYGLKKSEAFFERRKETARNNLEKLHSPESNKKRRDSWCKTRRMEQFRFHSGMRQKTRLKFAVLPYKTQEKMWYLYHKYGYDYNPRETVMYYDASTKRDVERERYYSEKYGLRFVEDDTDKA